MADFSRVIDMADVSPTLRARAFVGRAAAQTKPDLAIADYSAAIDLTEASAEQRARALHDRGMAYRRQGNESLARADLASVAAMADAPEELRTSATEALHTTATG
jgi:regulator of sirC expression with transglutaminase-like and TPR domain